MGSWISEYSTFQSTHPREGVRRLTIRKVIVDMINFNPRTPAKECDKENAMSTLEIRNFNPRTPAKECDDCPLPRLIVFTDFNPRTPAKECDLSRPL